MSDLCPPKPQPSVRCSVIIATLDRVGSLRLVLACLGRQTRPPFEVIIAAAGDSTALSEEIARLPAVLPVRLLVSPVKSSALQRNQAADEAVGDVLAFLDDDIEFDSDLFARVLAHFDRLPESELGALSPRLANTGRLPPGILTRWYYALQAGYSDADYGGRLFGPGINCFPIFASSGSEWIRSDWLPSTCLFIRTPLFQRHRFPAFTGYSFAEDVHLTARVAREAPVFFLSEPAILHHSLPSEFKNNRAALTAGKLHNMALIAREVLGRRGWSLWWRWQLHRVFMTTVLLLRRPFGWNADLCGVWRARL
jgi:glycosyltransferase involved in cell wall biosynthesis